MKIELSPHLTLKGDEDERREIVDFLVQSYRAIDAARDAKLASYKKAGYQASCRSGCSSCCYDFGGTFQVEMIGILDLISSWPAEKLDALHKRMDEWADLRQAAGIAPVVLDETTSQESMGAKISNFVRFAAENGSPCVFLENGKCSVYAARPVSCRLHVSFSPASDCKEKLLGNAQVKQPDLTELSVAWLSSLIENGFDVTFATDPSQMLLLVLEALGRTAPDVTPDLVISSGESEMLADLPIRLAD